MSTINPTERAELIETVLNGAEELSTSALTEQLQDLEPNVGSRSSITRTLNNMAEHGIVERRENGVGYLWSTPQEEEEDPFTKMETKHLVRSYVQDYGKGFSYQCYRNGEYVGSMTDLLRDNNPDVGDEIRLEVTTTGRYKYHVTEIELTIENTEEAWDRIEYMKRLRKQKSKASGPRDYQRQKLYDWERSYIEDYRNNPVAGDSLEEKAENSSDFATQMAEKMGFNEEVTVKGNRRRSTKSVWKHNDGNTIDMAPKHMHVAVVIHETAHGVIEWTGLQNRVASHGPAFVRVFIDMLAEFYNLDREDMIEHAREEGNLDVLDESLPYDELVAEKESNKMLSNETVDRFKK